MPVKKNNSSENKEKISPSSSSEIPIGAVILILFGSLFLLYNFGILSGRLFSYIWRLWPLILIIIGFKILSNRK